MRGLAHNIPGQALGCNRDGQQRQHRGDKAQCRIEPHQNIIQPNEPIWVHVHQPVASGIDDVIVAPHLGKHNLECPNPAFAQVEGCRYGSASYGQPAQKRINALLTLMSILQFFRPNNEIA